MATAKNEQKVNSFTCIFLRILSTFQKGHTSEDGLSNGHFCRTPLSGSFCGLYFVFLVS